MSGFELRLKINNQKIFATAGVIDAAFQLAGNAWISAMRKYPKSPQGTYQRTGNLGKQVKYRIASPGKMLELVGPKIATYVLMGTGIYGPKGTPITPVSARFLSWVVTNGSHAQFGQRVYAKSVKGFIWEGKLAEVKLEITRGFKLGIKSALKK